MHARVRNWCFTSFVKPEPNTDKIQYMVYQKEKCPKTQREHFQGYVEFGDKQRMQSVKTIFNDNTLHVEPRRGTQRQAIAYCKKAESRIEDPVEFGEAKSQGQRTDLDEIYDDIEDGCTMKEILSSHGAKALKYLHCVEKAMKVKHDLFALDDYILVTRKKKKDKLDDVIEDKLYKHLYK